MIVSDSPICLVSLQKEFRTLVLLYKKDCVNIAGHDGQLQAKGKFQALEETTLVTSSS